MGMFRPIVRSLALKWFYRQLFGESVARGAARIVATSTQERQELIEEGIARDKIVIRRNGIVQPERLPARGDFRRQWKIPQDALLVLFLGRIVSKKSPELLLEAFARWQASSKATQRGRLVIAGPVEDTEYAKKLEAQAQRLGLAEAVLFTGPLYDDAKWAALTDADIFVLPSQNENFGNAAAEAVACGTPAIVTDRCGIAPFIESRAGIVIPHECVALACALQQLSDASYREGMKARCAEVARGLGWDEPLAETEALYAECDQHPRPLAGQGHEARQGRYGMCGICVVVGADGAVVAKRVRKMINALVHRGPDGEGILDRPGVVFGIRRLSIIDLSSGQQPIYNETGDVGVVFNGEIYNFLQLRATLESRSHRFHTRCDTEIIVHAYEEWGDRCVEHLDGKFSFALWDGKSGLPEREPSEERPSFTGARPTGYQTAVLRTGNGRADFCFGTARSARERGR
jgi:hypothetical protein